MGKLSQIDYQKVLRCLRDIYSLADSEQFPQRLLEAVSRVVRAKSIAFTEVDPVLQRSTGCFYPHEPFEKVAEPFQRNIQDHPVIRYAERTRDGSAKAISDFLTAKQFRATGLYREVFEPRGLLDQLSIGMVGSAGLMIGISFNRARTGFSRRDRDVLNLLRPHVLQAYLNCRARHGIDSRNNERQRNIIEQLPLGLICVDANGRIAWSTAAAEQMLQNHYSDAADSIHGLPDAVRHWLKRVSSADDKNGEIAPQLVSRRPGFELRLRFCPLSDGRTILLLQEPPIANEAPLVAEFGFTKREQQVAQRIVNGDSVSDVSGSLTMSPRTVQKHLERIFRKLGVNNLAAACVKMLKRDVHSA
jgi:DNA-binding CsgD family transcriptional regulator